jgi:hypothetical protein
MFTTVLNWCFTPPLAASEAGAHGIDVHQLLPRSEEHDALSMMVGAWMVEIETQWINVVYMFVYVMHVCVLKHIYIIHTDNTYIYNVYIYNVCIYICVHTLSMHIYIY